MSPNARVELAKSSREIAGLLPDPVTPQGRPSPFKGVVVGAVQSGKTASMMGVASIAIDQGYRIVIVLAGGKDDLRQQTARRFNTQLLQQSDDVPGNPGLTTLGRPKGKGPLGGFSLPFAIDANQFDTLLIKMQSALRKNEPCVLVIKKNVSSLGVVKSTLQYLYSSFPAPLPTIVLDDECDDASVDASTEAVIPVAIANLWRTATSTIIAYVGYTATAAANLLQSEANELYPSHFVYLLRYPGSEDSVLQFLEPNADAWYTGGNTYYEAFGDEPGEASNFMVSPTIHDAHLAAAIESNPSLLDALRAYFVSGAYRLALNKTANFTSPSDVPAPHALLLQASAETDEHSRWARGIKTALGGTVNEDRTISFSAQTLLARVRSEEPLWRSWYEHFEKSRDRLYYERPHPGTQKPVSWEEVFGKLGIVFEHTRLKVVNSDPAVRTELDFSPRLAANGGKNVPQDIYVIVVGGAKLSRGITIDGLAITYFARWSDSPTEDTVLQLSRWFGYRGPFLEFCRVFMPLEVYVELRQMTENDTDLRFQLAELMKERKTPAEATFVLRANPRALPTSKIGAAAVYDLAYSPHTSVMPYVEIEALSDVNELTALEITKSVRSRGSRLVKATNGVVKGELSRGWGAEEVADLLDSFEYSKHNPDNSQNPHRDFYRQADPSRPMVSTFSIAVDPYQVAAYLRAWSRDHGRRFGPPPPFNVGFAYGEMTSDCLPFDFPLSNRQVTSEGRIVAGWGGRSANWSGDAYLDDPPVEFRAPRSYTRFQGAEGLLLLYVVHKDAQGRGGEGIKRPFHTPTIGISIPAGGPPFRRVVSET